MAETGGIEDGAGAEDFFGREAGELSGEVSHNVHGVSNHENDAMKAACHDLFDHTL